MCCFCFYLQMNRPIQVKPADSESRAGLYRLCSSFCFFQEKNTRFFSKSFHPTLAQIFVLLPQKIAQRETHKGLCDYFCRFLVTPPRKCSSLPLLWTSQNDCTHCIYNFRQINDFINRCIPRWFLSPRIWSTENKNLLCCTGRQNKIVHLQPLIGKKCRCLFFAIIFFASASFVKNLSLELILWKILCGN